MWNWLKSSKTLALKQELDNAVFETEQGEASKIKVIVITGTSGSGRKGMAKRLSTDLGIPYILPYTTRAIRPHEQDGVHYHFITSDQFQSMVEKHVFFQTVYLERGSYGIAEEELSQPAIVVVNREGAQAFRKHYGNEAIRIFLYVTKDDIRLRLEREEAPDEIMEEYLHNYTEQVIYKKESEYLLQNIEPAATIEKIKEFLQDKL
ncbi:guanylate kinase [Paenibacillus monticola]|uniref:Guanylate kinase n=1 Tax=Paenibacillus monticola TaxID=2666075 RepID=A0A7X2L361_9BACL|nr:guanylate kinase [Paenibacillus monticola]MRN54021.1 guanylate kinase [Paenibacillus monticola]